MTTTARIAGATAAVLIGLSACGSETAGTIARQEDAADSAASSASEAAASASEDAEDAEESSSPSPSDPAPTSDPAEAGSGTAAFGDTYEWEDGLAVTISPARPYTPGEYALVPEPPPAAYVAFDVTITNGTTANFEPTIFLTSLQSGGREQDEVYDGEVGGSPDTTLLPGRDVTFTVAYGVADPADLVLEVQPGFDYESALFATP
ncbi:hypothetical protein GB931_06630 [Modestobacter sp. I12A-02628]|uniref:DUF4352 domain-containing protein n=1 Tax=Goekera deserti TaxID=2497753 RepID=A0A7K3WAQ5_9ACTN|nr:hypothetical protein [Goekera deserti]MPQ97599.1 hypothetical protein [Goekera deserti]NEL53545.1 hypothetical protein [Goekera deserti]